MRFRPTFDMALAAALVSAAAQAADGPPAQRTLGSFNTLVATTLAIEGLTGDNAGALYTVGRSPGAGLPCPVWRIALSSVTPLQVGQIPAPSATGLCAPSGLAFGPGGALFVAESDKVYTLVTNPPSRTPATVFASGLPGANGLAFDASGRLWVSDGTTGLGRVWRIAADGSVTEAFRIPPMTNGVGVGRDNRSVPTGNSQPLVANGLAFDTNGDLIVADTARGALWRVGFDAGGNLAGPLGCDTTFSFNTLCFDAVWVAHPLLEGADGIALDRAGNVWAAANERNAMVFVDRASRAVTDAYRSPPDAVTGLRNAGPLEFPTSPFLLGDLLCTANSDGNRRDNSPSTAGEIGGAGQPRGKLSCLDQRLAIPGLPLPVRPQMRR